MQDQTSSTSTNTRRDRPPSTFPTSGDGAPASDTGDSGRAAYEDLFGTPALEESTSGGAAADSPAHVWGNPEAEPDTIPNLRFTAYPPERAAYAAAFLAAYRYPDALQLVMSGIRKGLERGQKAARRAGGERR